MPNPRSLIHALYIYWDTVEHLVRLSREYAAFTSDQVLKVIAKASPQLDAEGQNAVLRSLVNADILQTVVRSSDLQMNNFVLDFTRSLTKEHELSLAAVLQARVAAIREANQVLNEAMVESDIDRMREFSNKLSELFRQITLQLEQDKHAILDLVEVAKAADSSMPIAQRYHRVLEAYDQYVEPMNQMMDSGSGGTFYHYLEESEQSLDLALEQLSVQGALYSHRLQLRQVTHQAKELRRFGRVVALHCADTLLPLREELRQHNQLSSAISQVLQHIRKRGLRRGLATALSKTELPLWRSERGFKIQVGDEIRAVMADAYHYQPLAVEFPLDDVTAQHQVLEHVDEVGIRAHLDSSLPINNLLAWLLEHYSYLQDATLLRIFHDLQHETNWLIESSTETSTMALQTIAVSHYPHHVTKSL